jgi:hypothetical protein
MAALKLSIHSARERLACALETKDYATALACQVEIDDLQREAHRLERRRNHDLIKTELRPLKPLSFSGVWRV